MRFGIYSLAGLVRNELGFDPSSGDVFVFLSKRLNQIRLLQWDRDGFAMYCIFREYFTTIPGFIFTSNSEGNFTSS
jgi:transposase